MAKSGENNSEQIAQRDAMFTFLNGADIVRVCRSDTALVSLGVQCQVVGPRESARTVKTAKRLGSSVFANVPRQLVRTSKVPLTTGKVATIRFFACNAHHKSTSS